MPASPCPACSASACAARSAAAACWPIRWPADPAYPKTAAGLAAAYVAGIPFFQWTVLGTLVYAALLFGGFELLRNRMPALRPQTV